ncbi:hypothetical protein [Streptomyces sp. NPDC096132]|uniref:hypothetical protein n=1 Tax=Streptomyces sp. NPDC096132 TaxID=3366075 RepID=UPI003829E0E7
MAKIIEAMWEGKLLAGASGPEAPGRVLDLMAALSEWVAQARAARGEDAAVREMAGARRKAAAGKAAAQKRPPE